jgi:hypothetical protein
VYCPTHKPYDAPNQVIDTTMSTQMGVPESAHGKLEYQKSDSNHQYGHGAVVVETATNAPKPPTNVDNINKIEVRHQGVNKFTSS